MPAEVLIDHGEFFDADCCPCSAGCRGACARAIDVGRGPIGDIAVDADGATLVATNSADGSVVDSGRRPAAGRRGGACPGEPFAVAAAGGRAFVGVSAPTHDLVEAVDTRAMGFLASLPLDLGVVRVAARYDGGRLFVGATTDDAVKLARIDVESGRVDSCHASPVPKAWSTLFASHPTGGWSTSPPRTPAAGLSQSSTPRRRACGVGADRVADPRPRRARRRPRRLRARQRSAVRRLRGDDRHPREAAVRHRLDRRASRLSSRLPPTEPACTSCTGTRSRCCA